MVVWENNRSAIARATDYLITDIEFVNGNSRFDMIGVRRAVGSRKWTPVIIEMKYGGDAIEDKGRPSEDGKPTKASGVIAHLDDMERYLKEPGNNLRREIGDVYGQLKKLGLLPHGPRTLLFSEESPEAVFMLANYNPRSVILDRALAKIEERIDKMIDADIVYDLRFPCARVCGLRSL